DPISPEFFMESYKKQLEKFEDILCITSSSKLSDNYDSAVKGREMLSSEEREHIYVIDSKNISAGQSLLILEAIEMVAEQRKIKEVVSKIERAIDNINMYCIIERSDWWNKEKNKPFWFNKSPRYSLGKMREGEIVHMETIRTNNFSEALFKRIERDSLRQIKEGKRIRAVISHGDNPLEAEELKKKLKTIKKTDISFINITDPITSINACPQSLLVGWIIK
ncbi:MAG: DegV family protein, partial [Candidatus Pacebacteria bacterium]|nr:DegV family protein [Candidatus Paceibacterota bacterium]